MTDQEEQNPNQPVVMKNTIVLNERATRDILSGVDFNLQMNQGMLLDILLKEIINLKREKSTNESATDGAPPALRVLLENPEIMKYLTRVDQTDQHHSKKQEPLGINNDSSLKDSAFAQSQPKKGDGRKRGLSSINEGNESKGYEDDFESVKQDDHIFSLSNSRPANEPNTKLPNNSSKRKFSQNANRFEEGKMVLKRILSC